MKMYKFTGMVTNYFTSEELGKKFNNINGLTYNKIEEIDLKINPKLVITEYETLVSQLEFFSVCDNIEEAIKMIENHLLLDDAYIKNICTTSKEKNVYSSDSDIEIITSNKSCPSFMLNFNVSLNTFPRERFFIEQYKIDNRNKKYKLEDKKDVLKIQFANKEGYLPHKDIYLKFDTDNLIHEQFFTACTERLDWLLTYKETYNLFIKVMDTYNEESKDNMTEDESFDLYIKICDELNAINIIKNTLLENDKDNRTDINISYRILVLLIALSHTCVKGDVYKLIDILSQKIFKSIKIEGKKITIKTTDDTIISDLGAFHRSVLIFRLYSDINALIFILNDMLSKYGTNNLK